MSNLQLSLSCWDYDRTRALQNGDVKVKGIDLIYLPNEAEETFWRMVRHQEFDISEMSMSSYMIGMDKYECDYRAIPVFPSRVFRHSSIFINADSGICRPEDLKGKKIGVPEYQITASLWIRGILRDEYGVNPEEVIWYQGGEEQPGRVEKLKIELPENIELHYIGENQTLNEMLLNGEIDALITARAPSSFITHPHKIKRLFENYKEVEQEYYKKTGIFPIMHTIVIKKEILEKYPWVAQNLYQAFEEAKKKCFSDLNQTVALKTSLPWLNHHMQETKGVMGEMFWPYGIEENRHTLEKMVEYSYNQGLISKKFNLEDLFITSTFDKFLI